MGAFKLESASLNSVSSSSTLTCKFNLKCTSKYGLNIVPANFQVEVTPKDSSKTVTTYHAYNTLTKSNNYLKKDESLETELKVTNIKVADGDTIQVKFWPRPQASEGSQAYTRAFCTWKMTAKVDATTEKVTFE